MTPAEASRAMVWKRIVRGRLARSRQIGFRIYEDQLTIYMWRWSLDVQLGPRPAAEFKRRPGAGRQCTDAST